MGLGKNFTKKCAQLHVVFAVETNLSFWWDLEKFSKKCAQAHVSSLWRLSWVFEGTWKVSTKRCGHSHIFSQGRLSWVFEGTWKVSTKRCDQLHIFFAVQTILSFWWDLESVDKKQWPVAPFWQYRLSQVFDGTWKNFHKKIVPSYKFWIGLRKVSEKASTSCTFLAVQTIWSFWMAFRKISTKMCAQLHVFSLWRLTWVFDGTWKVSTKRCDQLHIFFAVQTISSFRWDLEKFPQNCVPSYTFFRCGD